MKFGKIFGPSPKGVSVVHQQQEQQEEAERPEVFRGHFEECLSHFSRAFLTKHPKNSKGAHKAKMPIADFCGVIPDTVTRWLDGLSPLIGSNWVKMVCLFDLIGYRVIELERMPKAQRGVFELIGFGVLSAEEVARISGYSKSPQLYMVFRGELGAPEKKKDIMWETWKQHREKLDAKKQALSRTFASTAKIAGIEEISSASASRHSAMVSILEGLLDLLEERLSENPLGADLKDFQKSIAAFSDRLGRLKKMAEERSGRGH